MSSSDVAVTGGDDQTIYGSEDAAISYWLYGLGPVAKVWSNASDDDRIRGLVNATRILNGIEYAPQYATFEARSAIDEFDTICYELAGAVLANPTILTSLSTGSNIKRADAGDGVGVEFFNETLSTSGRFPPGVSLLLAKYLGPAPGTYTGPSWSSGTGDCPSPSGYWRNYGLNGGS